MSSGGLLQKQARNLLKNEHLALLAVVVLMLLPYMAWLAMSVVALVTLRNGIKQGLMLVIPAFTAHVIVLLFSVQLNTALFEGLIRVLPCYGLACVLRLTASWQVVAAVFALFALLVAMALQMFAPELISNQFIYFKLMMRQMDSGLELLHRLEKKEISAFVLSNYLVGIQMVCLCASALSSLLFARMLQSNLFYPEGFYQEMLNYRGDKLSLLMLGVVAVAAYFQQAVAINCLPLLLFYFFMAGLSFSVYLLAQVKPFLLMLLLGLPCVMLPRWVLPFYVVLGGLDSVVNFRFYLRKQAGKST